MIQIGLTDYTPQSKIIDIKNKKGAVKAKYAIGAKDLLKHTLMSEHYIEVSFELNRSVAFRRSDYIQWEGDKYTLRADYIPEQVNKRQYRYTLKFEAVEMLFQDIQYYYLNQNLKESEWRLTGNAAYFIQIAVDNINRYFGTKDFTVGTIEPAEIKDIVFTTNTHIFDALTQIADEYQAEWYLTGKTLHLVKKVSFGSEVDFETDVSVVSMKREEGDNNTRYTRIVALGSTRNLTNDYRAPSTGEAVDAIYPKRLRIPVAKGDVIDVLPDMSPEEVVEGTVIFDEVYPKRVGTIEAVGTIEYTDTDEETGKQTKWNAYKFKDSGINFKEEYMLPGQELRVSFQSGNLNGRDFALVFRKKGFSETDPSQYFEIVRTDDYGTELPNDTLKPHVGDTYVLYGFNIALVSEQYVPQAEQELYDTAAEWLRKQLTDTSVYECDTAIKHFADNLMDLAIGQKVRLVHEQFDGGYRSSRVMGFEKRLNNKYHATYTVGDNPAYSRFGKLEDDVKELQHAGIVYQNLGGGGSVYLIKQFDTTRPTDFNVYSAMATNAKYFNKQTGDTVTGDALFRENLQVQGIAIADVFQNSTFTAGQLGSGFQIKRDANGKSYMEVDNIMVRDEAVFNRLTIAEIKSVGGTILLSLASMVIAGVEDKPGTWKCYFDHNDETIPNDFAVGDQAICRKYTGKNIKYYWAVVTAVGADYIELSKTDKEGSGSPAADDEVIQLGNRADVNRQHAIMLSAYGSDAPSIKQYSGIDSFDMTGKEVTVLSPDGNKFTGAFTVSTNGTDAPVYKDVGRFENGKPYYLHDRVSHLGSYWVCIVAKTIQMPHEDSAVWRKDTAGSTDITNAVDELRRETYSGFKVLSDEITSSVTEIKNYTDNTFTAKTIFNTEIEQLSNRISLKASQEDLNAAVSRIRQAEIKLEPDNIQLIVKDQTEKQVSEKSNVVNLFRDGSFEYGYTHPTTTGTGGTLANVRSYESQSEAPPLFGKRALFAKMWGYGDAYFYLNQQTPVIGGRTYTIVFWHHDGGDPGATASYLFDSTGSHYLMPMTWGYGWHKEVWKWTAPADATWIQIRFGRYGTDPAWSVFDGVMIIEGDLTFTPDSYIECIDDINAGIDKAQSTADSKTTLDEVASSLTIAGNKISLASKTIELKGTTIAQAIEAEDLKVGSRDGVSALEVRKDGIFYAKGSSSSNSSLTIDSATQTIKIKSPKSSSGEGEPSNYSSEITISSSLGAVETKNTSGISIMSANGFYTNQAKINPFPDVLGYVPMQASVAALGTGSLNNGTGVIGVVGVYGEATNSGNAPAYGGYFNKLRANGLIMNVKIITTSYTLQPTDVVVNSYATSDITVWMPRNPYIGQTYIIRRVSSSGIKLNGNGYQIWRDNPYTETWVDSAKGDTTMMIFDGNYWQYYKMVR